MNDTLPVEGWVRRWASYSPIVRAVVTGIRDHGPLDVSQVRLLVREAGIGGDVAKAAPSFDATEGAKRIVNLLCVDIDVIKRDGDTFTVDPSVESVYSKMLDRFITIPSAEEATTQREYSVRFQQLRRWITERPFQNVWRNGIRTHSDEEIATLAAQIDLVGYYGPQIVCDQHGVIINGRLRIAALEKLGKNPADYTQEIFFPDDTYRLAWIINSHYQDGRWPTDLRKEIIRYINHTMARSGVKMEWPADIPLMTGHFDEVPVLSVAPQEEQPVPNLTKAGEPEYRPKTKVTTGMLTLLERGGSMPKAMLEKAISNKGSFFHRAREVGHVELINGKYVLTEEGMEIARRLWKRDRPGRNVPM
jgi:hypothetical protein